jgi:hypothetical protein
MLKTNVGKICSFKEILPAFLRTSKLNVEPRGFLVLKELQYSINPQENGLLNLCPKWPKKYYVLAVLFQLIGKL